MAKIDLARYSKTAVAAILAGGYALQAALTDSTVTNTEWIGIGVAVLTALGVFIVPNKLAPVEPVVGSGSFDSIANVKAGLGYAQPNYTVTGASLFRRPGFDMDDPDPQPQPVPSADADDTRLWAAIRTWTLGGHGSTTRAPAANLVDWAARKGLT